MYDQDPAWSNSSLEETRLSMAMENYLLSIFRLHEQGIQVNLTQLSSHLKTLPAGEGLGTSLASVGGMIRRMGREGLISKNHGKDVVLTKIGNQFAGSIVRRHRLAECMVVELLGMELQKAHIEAHRLEHAISPELEEKIRVKLGNPKTCPFGHPVPGSGYTSQPGAISLDRAPVGVEMVIDRIPEDDQPLLDYLVTNGLIPRGVIVVNEAAATRGVITLSCNGQGLTFSYAVSAKIWAYKKTE